MEPLLDSAPFGFVVVTDDGHVEAANRTMCEILDLPREKIVGHHVDGFFTTPSRIFYQSHVFPTLKLQGRINEVYVSLRSGAGDEVPVLLNARRHEGRDGSCSDW